MIIIKNTKLPIKIWAISVEKGAMQQALNLSELPFAFSHIALMPDVHQGYGMPIGGVLATKDQIIIPNAVGVDIGCGITAIKTDISKVSKKDIKKTLNNLETIIPVGFKHNTRPQNWEGFDNVPDISILKQEIKSAKHQLSSLGSGNHFCSIEFGNDGNVWLMVHSGSRNIGFKVAKYYNDIAKKLNHILPKKNDLAPLSLDSPEGKEYFEAMNYCLKFAKANRKLIIDKFFTTFSKITGAKKIRVIDCHHNYASEENHFGKNVIIHRKGAIKAMTGEMGIIPGSMGTPSYIVEGLGSPESFYSCSHGAGRLMSRKEANKIISETMANKAMEGIEFKGWKGDYSEAPMAYKDIEEVISLQRDLIKPIVKLTPLGVMKG